jgi:putative copper resistance protein D
VIDFWYAAARTIHIAASLLIFALCIFDRLVTRFQCRRLFVIAWLIALVSGVGWFLVVAINMSGLPPAQALTSDVLGVVWRQTHFGTLWEIRLILWLLIGIAAILPDVSGWLTLIVSSLFVVNLAWSGHGQTGGDGIHLAADAAHLLIAGCWPTALLPFVLFLFKFRNDRASILDATNRFSALSVACVVLLGATGVVNSYFLVGSISNLVTSDYGRVLTIKIALFAAMIGLGAVNKLRLKPRLAADESVAMVLRRSVMAEMALAALVFIVLGILGMLPPAAGCG